MYDGNLNFYFKFHLPFSIIFATVLVWNGNISVIVTKSFYPSILAPTDPWNNNFYKPLKSDMKSMVSSLINSTLYI